MSNKTSSVSRYEGGDDQDMIVECKNGSYSVKFWGKDGPNICLSKLKTNVFFSDILITNGSSNGSRLRCTKGFVPITLGITHESKFVICLNRKPIFKNFENIKINNPPYVIKPT